jgi:hypothetical protein
LRKDLEKKIERASSILAEEYREKGDTESSEEALRNITLANTVAVPPYDPFKRLCEVKKQWQELMYFTDAEAVRDSLKKVVMQQ